MKVFVMRSAVLVTGLGALLLSANGPAQAWDVLSPQLNAIEFGRQNSQSAEAASGESLRTAGPFSTTTSIATNLVSTLSGPQPEGVVPQVRTSFRNDPKRTQQNLRTFIKRTPEGDARKELKRLLDSQPTIIEDIGRDIRPYGLDPHDVADAYALWWMNAWLVANKRDEDPSRGTIAMVKQQVRNAIAATPDFAGTSDVDRQEYAEALLIQGAMLASAFEQFKTNPQMLDRLADAAKQGAKASGMNLSSMTLTRNGFEPRLAAEASGDGQQLAQEGAVEDSSIGLALAAGAGLGIVLLGGAAFLRKS